VATPNASRPIVPSVFLIMAFSSKRVLKRFNDAGHGRKFQRI
jgi:hypothetical protein